MLNMDSVCPNTSSKIIDQPPDVVIRSTECTEERENKYNTKMREDVAFSQGNINGENEEVHKENVSMAVSAVVTDVQQGHDVSTDQSPRIESELCENHACTYQNQDSIIENVKVVVAGPLDQSSYCLSGSVQIEKENDIYTEPTAAVSSESVLKEARNDLEAIQHRGVPRRLEFEDALHTVIHNHPAQSPSHSKGPKSPLEVPQTPIKGKQKDIIQPLYPRNTNTSLKIPKPSGIGLHLNSIVNSVQAGSGAIIHVKSAQRCNLSIWGKKPTPVTNSHPSDRSNSSSIFTIAEDVSASTDGDRREGHASLAVNSVTSLSTNIVISSDNSFVLNPVDDQSTMGNKRMYPNNETDGDSEEYKSSPKKKRKKSSDFGDGDGDGDGCKRCNCKKSRCLKLYCDCFAAGMYCAEPCACQGCYNRPEYVDTVLETRQQIESRNPLAFAPKIVQHIIDPPASSYGDDGTKSTASSARHKRGCNCKKSMCLKKYCECYQANVGCSDGCGCERCKNVFGQKGENGMDKYFLSKEGANERRTDGSFIEKTSLSGDTGLRHSELQNAHKLTPTTPSVQFSNQKKGEPKAGINFGLTSITPYAITPGSSRSSETAGEILDLVSYDQELYYGNSETLDEFSTVCHQPQKTGNCSMSSLSWHGSPNTPTAQSSGIKPLKAVVDLESELSNTTQDDTPDILKDSSTPDNEVKVSSPNKKRVSPPHGPQREFGSSSSVGLRTGRKYILKAVSSFPPLTPCVDSKSTVAQQTNDPQNPTTNK